MRNKCKPTVENPGVVITLLVTCLLMKISPALSQDAKSPSTGEPKKEGKYALEWPPKLPGNKTVTTDKSVDFLEKPQNVRFEEGVEVAKTPPTIDLLYFPGQTFPGRLWSVWGDGSAHGNKYYTGIGDHDAKRGKDHKRQLAYKDRHTHE